MARGKRKVEALQGEEGPSRKRRAGAEENSDQSASDEEPEEKNEDEEEEVDAGRIESQEMLRVIERLTHKDDGWLDNMRAQVKADEKALLDQLGAKERELTDIDTHFQRDMRQLLTEVLSVPAHRELSENDALEQRLIAIRPGHDHAHVLFDKSARLIESYDIIEKGMDYLRQHFNDDHLHMFDKGKHDVTDMLKAGQEIARRRVQQVVRRSASDACQQKTTKSLYTDEKLAEAEKIFAGLHDKQTKSAESEETEKSDVTEGPGLCPVIHNAKKGVKKLVAHLPSDDQESWML